MKEEALKAVIRQRPESPKLIQNNNQFDAAIKEHLLKEVTAHRVLNYNPKFVRKTRMGGHLSETLKKAGLANMRHGVYAGPQGYDGDYSQNNEQPYLMNVDSRVQLSH